MADSRAALAKRHVGAIAARLLGRRALKWRRRDRLARMHVPRSTARRGLNWELPSRESSSWRHHHGRDACHVRDHLHLRAANPIEGDRKPVQICVAGVGDRDLPSRSVHTLANVALDGDMLVCHRPPNAADGGRRVLQDAPEVGD